jgi:hypothetical protein
VYGFSEWIDNKDMDIEIKALQKRGFLLSATEAVYFRKYPLLRKRGKKNHPDPEYLDALCSGEDQGPLLF